MRIDEKGVMHMDPELQIKAETMGDGKSIHDARLCCTVIRLSIANWNLADDDRKPYHEEKATKYLVRLQRIFADHAKNSKT